MQHQTGTAYQSPGTRDGLLVLDGYGIRVTVQRRHLFVTGGLGRERRWGRFSRATARLKRLVVLGHTGAISFESLRWLHDISAAFIQIDADGKVIVASGPGGLDDPRLRRMQALAMTHPIGLEIARGILLEKLRGEDHALGRLPGSESARDAVKAALKQTEQADSLDRLLVAEAAAAAAYWSAWAGVAVNFVRVDQNRIPDHWKTFGQRSSPLTGSPRLAANPANAVLNYLYAILEAESRIACLTVGLDPGLGILHADQRARDSLALDVMEAVRPQVDAFVLETLRSSVFRAADFYEARQGVCRVLPSLTHVLAETAPVWARSVAPVAERVARILAEAPGSRIDRIPTPLTQKNRSHGRARLARRPKRTEYPRPSFIAFCRMCGQMTPSGRSYCDDCLPRLREEILDGFQKGAKTLARLRAEGRDPTHGEAATQRRAASISMRKREAAAWDREHVQPDPTEFTKKILPRLRDVPVRQIVKATGLSLRYCSMIRRGLRVPHPLHWESLRTLTQT